MDNQPPRQLTHFGKYEGVALSALMVALVMLPLGSWAAGRNTETQANQIEQQMLLAGLGMGQVSPDSYRYIRYPEAYPTRNPHYPTPRASREVSPHPEPSLRAIPITRRPAQYPTYPPPMNQEQVNQVPLTDITLPPAAAGSPYFINIPNSAASPGRSASLMTTRLPEGLRSYGCMEKPQLAEDDSAGDCLIAGTPRYSGTYSFTVTVTVPGGQPTTNRYNLTVSP